MYIINFSGTRKEYYNRLKEIFSIFKIVRSELKDEDFKLIIEGEKLKEKGTE